MPSRLALGVALGLTIALGACGSQASSRPANPDPNPNPNAPTPPTPPQITATGDNWSFRLEGFTDAVVLVRGRSVPLSALEGAFNSSGTEITAVLNPFGACFLADTSDRARFSGTRSGTSVQLQSQALREQVIQLTGTLSAAGDAFEGTYAITGGCGNGRSGRMTGRRANLTGVWVGTMGKIPTVIDLQVATAPDADANYVISGTVKFSDTECFQNAVITRRFRGRVGFPDIVSETHRLEAFAEVTEDLSTMFLSFALVSGTCPELSIGDGRLVRQ